MSQPDAAPQQQQSESKQEQGLPTHSEDGVDLTLIRWMLSMTPAERLRAGQQYARSVLRIRNARKNT